MLEFSSVPLSRIEIWNTEHQLASSVNKQQCASAKIQLFLLWKTILFFCSLHCKTCICTTGDISGCFDCNKCPNLAGEPSYRCMILVCRISLRFSLVFCSILRHHQSVPYCLSSISCGTHAVFARPLSLSFSLFLSLCLSCSLSLSLSLTHTHTHITHIHALW